MYLQVEQQWFILDILWGYCAENSIQPYQCQAEWKLQVIALIKKLCVLGLQKYDKTMQAKLGVNYEGFSALIIYVASNNVLFGSLFACVPL